MNIFRMRKKRALRNYVAQTRKVACITLCLGAKATNCPWPQCDRFAPNPVVLELENNYVARDYCWQNFSAQATQWVRNTIEVPLVHSPH